MLVSGSDGPDASGDPQHWTARQPDNCYNFNERTVNVGGSEGLNDVNLRRSYPDGLPTICKKPAVKKELPLEITQYDMFDMNGKKCRNEPVKHWNRRCPTNSSLWKIVQSEAGVHCYALVDTPLPLTRNNFTHELCHVLHPDAKLASFHYDLQFGFLYPLTDRANKIIVGKVMEDGGFYWADHTPENKSFWAPSEPFLNLSEVVVHIQNIQLESAPSAGCGGRPFTRPLLKTMMMKDVKPDMKIACKVEAEPLLPCTPLPDADNMKSLNNTVCPDGWTKQRFCDNVWCYNRIPVAAAFADFVHAVEHDYCHSVYENAYLASIHCIEEHFFVQSYAPKTLIGLHIPSRHQNDTFDVKNFKWTDGTPVDFVGWNRFSIAEGDGYAPHFPPANAGNEILAHFQVYNKIADTYSGWSNKFVGYEDALCKMKAAVTQTD
uniref:C-type lectin domain-containing protein n=1 Tax=Panagrellus redivivus TaxID=6233 RepID=A0A7E4W8J1_PANRE